jgi:5-methylcytosine-specific restriction endonuclease McrA
MQPHEIKRLAENWFRPRLYERISAFHNAGQSKLGEFVARGWTASPHMYGGIQILAGQEIELRGSIILEGYARALGTAAEPIAPELQRQIAGDMESAIAAESEQVRQSIQYVADSCKPFEPHDAATLRSSTLAKVAVDFDLLCAKWNSEHAAKPPQTATVASRKSTRPKLPARIQKQVFQEAGSRCVFCPERDVSALQIHHIDSDRANNAFDNLILVCASCHTKITAGVIAEAQVVTRKRQLKFEPQSADIGAYKSGATVVVDRTINTGTIAHTVNKFAKGRTPRMHYPPGTIGSDAIRHNYIDYLITRYFEFRKADASYGSRRPFAFPEIHKSIQKRFGAKTFFVLLGRFDEMADYLRERIDNTILGRNNRSRGTRSYKSFSEYEAEQMNATSAR